METNSPEETMARYRRAKARRGSWENLWGQCYEFALPQRDGALSALSPCVRKSGRLFDATAADAVDQLAASLVAQLTLPWSRWFGLAGGSGLSEEERGALGEPLEQVASVLQTHFDRSNFTVEIHPAFLDLVTVGTASILFEEADPGEPTAVRLSRPPIAAHPSLACRSARRCPRGRHFWSLSPQISSPPA